MRAHEGTSVDPSTGTYYRFIATAALTLTVLAVWALTHEYRGLVYDGQIYAVQALAKLRPSLNADLFLQNTTQDDFTIFPRVYAWVISWIGLNPAALLLTVLCSVWFSCAAWKLSSHLFNSELAWLGIFLVIITGGSYGAFGVFHFLEPFLTARLPAEALVVTALAIYLRGFVRSGFALAAAALFVHPLMALPGLLLLTSMSVPWRASLTGAAAGVGGCFMAALAAAVVPAAHRVLPIMDAFWLEVVRERSQFLFLQLWTFKDWALSARPLVCLALAALVLRDPRIRTLAPCAMLVGATGLLIAGIASAVGPVAVLVQGQAWRWMWITTFLSVVLLLPTARQIWNEGKAGRPCAVLLLAGWSFPADIGLLLVSVAMLLWMLRDHRWLRSDKVAQAILAAISVSIVAWAVIATGTALASLPGASMHEQPVVSVVRAIFGQKIWCVLIALSVSSWVRNGRSQGVPLLVACAGAAILVFLFYQSSVRLKSYGSATDISAFADWRQVIPPSSTVFITNGHDSGSFVWFTLERNNYLSPGQSAGVVFSRATALEVRRRSEVLLPLMDPIWKLLTSMQRPKSTPIAAPPKHRPLTGPSLAHVCHDRALDFVISPDNVGFKPIRHVHSDAYANWNLYDCNRVRALDLTS